ncbi:MAG: TonB-dependent receptor [Ekhidna sp.]|uniref:TonB-dependent receptor n=1 Tax=Ekhidna sp. TaxID=2608089 RepID=UPI0032EB5C17
MKYRLLIIIWLLSSAVLAQEGSLVPDSLKSYLSYLSERHNVQFSYLDRTVEGKLISIDTTANLTLTDVLPLLEQHTRLRFERLTDDHVVVRSFVDSDLVSLCGYVNDYSGEPMIAATVSYSLKDGVFTDQSGYFKFDSIPYGARLTIRSVGYQTKHLNVKELSFSNCPKFKLGESVNVLDEVVVSNYLAAGIHKNLNAVKIDPDELKALSGLVEPDLLQSIQQAPGVNSPYETAAGLHVRGGLPDQNLVLWNGIKTYNQGHFFGMISAFNPYITDKVTFIKSGTSARYGDRVSSVIDIATGDEPSDRISGGAGTNMIYADGFVNLPLISSKLSLQLSARRSFSDVFETFTYNQMADRVFQNTKISEGSSVNQQSNNRFFFNDFTSNIIWQLNKNNKLSINALYNKNDLDFQSINMDINQSYNDMLLNANEGLAVNWKNASAPWSFDMDVNYAKYILQYDFIVSDDDTVTRSSKKNRVRESGARLNGSYIWNDKHRISLGYHFSHNQTQYAYETSGSSYNLVLDADNTTIQTHSMFTEYIFTDDEFHIQPGVRLNHYAELGETYVEPRLYMQKSLTRHISVSTSGEYRTQVASQIKESVVSDLSLENKVWALASSDRFPVIRSHQLTLGAAFKKKGWQIDLEGYRKKVIDVTTLIFGYLNPQDNEFRSGDSRIWGADLFIKKRWTSYESWISYSYVRTENAFTGLNNNEPFPGSWNIEHTVRWTNNYTAGKWSFSLGWMWHTGKSYTDVSDEGAEGPVSIVYGALNGNNLPVYHRLDCSALYEFTARKIDHIRYRIGLSVINLYDRRNLLNREFRTTPSLDNELIDTRVYSLGITPNLVFRIFF